MDWGQPLGSRRTAAMIAVVVTLVLVGCGTSLLPQQSQDANESFKTYAQLRTAYDRVVPGKTRASQLTELGFDASQPNVEVLSYLGVIERFMPRDSVKFDRLAPPVKACILAQDRCTAYVFKPSITENHRTGDTMLDVFGFDRTTVSKGWSAEVTLLMQDGRVAYKLMSGIPNISSTSEKVSPLGPLQDVGQAIVPAAEHAAP